MENRLSDYHCELELLTDEQKGQPAIAFCTQLEQRLMVGAYDEVMAAAANPPVGLFSFFLSGLLETVRVNIAECAETSYNTISLKGAKEILMFSTEHEAKQFITKNYGGWVLNGDTYVLKTGGDKVLGSSDVSSHALISQTLAYATELDRIV